MCGVFDLLQEADRLLIETKVNCMWGHGGLLTDQLESKQVGDAG